MGINVTDGNYAQSYTQAKTVTLRMPAEADEKVKLGENTQSNESAEPGTDAYNEAGRTDNVSISIEGFIKSDDEGPISKMRFATMTGDIDGFIKAAREHYRQQLPKETNWDSIVDPKGDIRGAAYVEALVRQYQEMENHIRDYYSDRHQENLNSDEPAAYIAGKYLIKDSKYFMDGMSRYEREMSYKQELAILWGGHLSLNDPYALRSYKGARSNSQIEEIANKAVRERMDSLIADYKKKNGIPD